MKHKIDPAADCVFKAILGSEKYKNLLIHFLNAVLQMNDTELQCESRRIFPQEQWLEYKALLDRKKTGKLTDQEKKCLDRLRHEADVLMFRRSYAAVLLRRRGYLIQKATSSQ